MPEEILQPAKFFTITNGKSSVVVSRVHMKELISGLYAIETGSLGVISQKHLTTVTTPLREDLYLLVQEVVPCPS